jgi:hypothetical protein
MSMAAAISGDDAKVFHWSEDPRAITCMTLDGVASDERRRAYLRRRASVPWRGTSMDGVHIGASRAVLQSMIDGIAGGCASLQPKMASSLGNCCSVGVTTAAGRVAGGVFMLCAEPAAKKLSTGNCYSIKAGSQHGPHGSCFQHASTPPPASRDRSPAPGTASRGASRDRLGYMVGLLFVLILVLDRCRLF